ncbi:MAG: hypothetical protein C0501_31255 [Isosphaera sp.]|nr:hypothetical protein [Isosphaera sp.]
MTPVHSGLHPGSRPPKSRTTPLDGGWACIPSTSNRSHASGGRASPGVHTTSLGSGWAVLRTALQSVR